jgi:hypothetical protein
MSVRGTIAVDVAFTDSTTTAGGSSLNTITLRDATEYTTGKVAIVTGTVGTTQVSVNTAPTTYRDASGAFISFSNISRVAFSASGSQVVEVLSNDSERSLAASMSSMVAVASCNVSGSLDIQFPTATAGTASYTLVIYGT